MSYDKKLSWSKSDIENICGFKSKKSVKAEQNSTETTVISEG